MQLISEAIVDGVMEHVKDAVNKESDDGLNRHQRRALAKLARKDVKLRNKIKSLEAQLPKVEKVNE